MLSALAAELVLLAVGLIQWHGRWVRSDEFVASAQDLIRVRVEGILSCSTYIFHICYFWFNLPDLPWCTSVIWISPLMIRGVIVYKWARWLSWYSDWATGWTVWGSNPSGGEIFCICPDLPWGPPSLLCNGYRVFPGGKVWPGHAADHSPPSSAVVMVWATLGL
jgi:hypothetical protein